MIHAKITSIGYGAQVVSLITELKKSIGVSLAEARSIIDRVIGGEPVTVAFKDTDSFQRFKKIAAELGAIVEP